MPSSVSRLRRWFAIGAIAACLVVVGAYLYARWRVQNALKQVPEKISLAVQQSAQGFTVSKSEQGRTIFTIQASKAVQFKQGGRAELHDVEITLYGHDSSRFDQIYGQDFDYDPQSGDVTAKGEVQIDLVSNPEGLRSPDQSPPKELKNPIHLKTRGLVFNQKTGNAWTRERVEFHVAQASGSAVGVSYTAEDSVLALRSQVSILLGGPNQVFIAADHGAITKNPRVVDLMQVKLDSGLRHGTADKATLFLRQDNSVERILAAGNVHVQDEQPAPAQIDAEQLELLMASQPGALDKAVFSGHVQMARLGPEPLEGTTGRMTLNFAAGNRLGTVRMDEGTKLLQHQKSSGASARNQDVELTAPSVDFFLAEGRRLSRAETSGPPQIAMRPASGSAGPQTLITAGRFEARFDASGQISTIHGEPDAHIVSSNPGQPDRQSTSHTADAVFLNGRTIEKIVQQGEVTYVDQERRASAERGQYTPGDQILLLTGSPRVSDKGVTTTARTIRVERATGDAFADGDVRSTYSNLQPQPNGALLASSSPIHVTSHTMAAHRSTGVAVYTGDAHLWQDANVVRAPSIQFDRDHRSVVALGLSGQPVSTLLVPASSGGTATPVTIESGRLTYTDNERLAHFEGGVVGKGADFGITADSADAYLQPGSTASAVAPSPSGKLEKIVAQNNVVLTQPNRRGTGDRLIYTAADDKFVLTGGPPSIFDAEHGKITGVSLTFYRHDDRVLVEGKKTSPTVTETRVAR